MEPDERSLSSEEHRLVREKAAVAMQLQANARSSKVGFWILMIGGSIALWFWNLWFLAAGFVVSFAAYFLIRESCVRAIERGMGLPAGAQAKLAERYTTDNEFKQAVDALYKSAAPFVDDLARKRPR